MKTHTPRLLSFFIFLCWCLAGCAQEPDWRFLPLTDSFAIATGNHNLQVIRQQYGPKINQPFFIHLHRNELTADSVLKEVVSKHGGQFLTITNAKERLVSFALNGKQYLFDPNRIFTQNGTKASLQLLSTYSAAAAAQVKKVANQVLQLLPSDGPLIAMHNNSPGAYSILQYAKGGTYAAETKALHRNPSMDPDDFVLTTSPELFAIFKEKNINALLQDNDRIKDDGSLGYYLGKKGRTYINIEAEHGHYAAQLQMTNAVVAALGLGATQ